MTLQIAALFALLAAMVYLFLTEKLPVDLTAFLGLVVLVFAGYVTPAEAFQGFSSPAVITMLSVFILGAALLETGVADLIAAHIHRLVGDSEIRLIVTLMVVAGVLSAFMNNIAATAVLMPAVATLAPRAGLAPSRLFMPLAFGAILGGTTTLVGTPPNILAGQMLSDRGLEPFKLFDFTPLGAAILFLGVIYMLTIGRKLLPTREKSGLTAPRSDDLMQVYQLEDRIFSLRLPQSSPLDGKTLAETRLGNMLGVKVVSIQRGSRRFEPEGGTELRGGDVLVVDGEAARVAELLKLQGVEVQSIPARQLPNVPPGVGGIRALVRSGASVAGKTLGELGFRKRFGIAVAAVGRGNQLFRDRLAGRTLQPGDQILGLGSEQLLERFAEEPDFEVVDTGIGALQELQDELCVLAVSVSSDLVGSTLGRSRLGELVGLTVLGIIRDDEMRLAVPADEIINAGDRLLLTADAAQVDTLADLGGVEIAKTAPDSTLKSDTMVEVAIAPRSRAEGRTLRDLDFRSRYGLLALALWRGGRPIHADLTEVALRFGDALLLHGPREKIRLLASETDFLVLSQADQAPRRSHKASFALGGLVLMIGLVATGFQPIHVAAFTAASLVILAGALTMPEAYRVIEWRAIFLVAAVLPVGFAMERTGAANFLADTVAGTAGPLGPYFVLGALIALASLLSQGLDGAPAVVLLAPVVIEMAERLDLSPYPLMMGVSLAASAAFMTPFSHKANLLVMGAGGYRSSDYLKVGTPLTIFLFILLTLLVPVFFPF
ncbi:MAG: SLC13 family permease [bacterium]|nr:SLC13 family permease [bacterium]